ncbi:MAG: NAD(P)H-hydrate epimerase [Pseudomonadota bacterium]|nr:NAD(P)H-hydrate epimerase [Pseudomonadota bacterium]
MHRILPPTRPWPLHSAQRTRLVETDPARTLEPHTLMRRAGDAVARLTMAVAPHAQRVWVAAGPGNNGGDGLEAAARLQAAGKQVQVTWLGLTDGDRRAPTDALDARDRAIAAGVQIIDRLPASSDNHDIAIDALLGIGAARAPTGLLAASIARLNMAGRPVVAVDLPSGLDANTGRWLGESCVNAEHTLALLTLKPGLFTAHGRDQAGVIWLDTLGASSEAGPDGPPHPDAWLSGAEGSTSLRLHAQHKGSFGDVAVVGGALGIAGAALLAGRAAQAAGAGRVIVEWLQDAASGAIGMDGLHPELMMRSGWSRSEPSVLSRATVVCGCGGGGALRDHLPRLLSLAGRLVLDADALNALAADPQLMALLRTRCKRSLATVLTPHPLEAARMLGCDTATVQSNRLAAARALIDLTGCVIVLKGSGSITAAPGRTPHINGTGNGSLASGGTGDALAGWLAGRWAQSGRQSSSATDEIDLAFSVASQAVADHGAAAEPCLPGALPAGELIRRLQHHLRHGRPTCSAAGRAGTVRDRC